MLGLIFCSFWFKYVLVFLILPLVLLLTAVTENFNELSLLLFSLEPATLWGKSLQDNLRLPILNTFIFLLRMVSNFHLFREKGKVRPPKPVFKIR